MILPSTWYCKGTIMAKRNNSGSTKIRFDRVVLSATGAAKDTLWSRTTVGQEVRISQEITSYEDDCSTSMALDWTKAYAAVGGSFFFLKDDVIQTFEDAGATERHPRTAIGYDDAYVYFVVCDGRDEGVSEGMSMAELGDFFKNTLGAEWAINQDGGGSSTMVVNGDVKNNPSDGSERAVANGMMMCNLLAKSQSTTFDTDDELEATGSANVRLGPGTNYAIKSSVSSGADGDVLEHELNGVYAKGYYWWYIDFSTTSGWVAESLLDYR